jgi:excisionase family DNA binding protein
MTTAPLSQTQHERNASSAFLYGLGGLAEYLGCHVQTTRRLRALGELPPAIRLGHRTLVWRRSDIDDWLEERREVRRDRRSARTGTVRA